MLRPAPNVSLEEPAAPEPSLARRRLLFCLDLLVRPLATGLLVWLAFQLPLPLLDDWLPIKNVVAAVLAITLAGKTLFDTLYYPRHPW